MYLTENNVEVTKRILKGETMFFPFSGSKKQSHLRIKDQAEAYARSKGSYTYPLYKRETVYKKIQNRNHRIVQTTFVGYAVPK